MAAPNGPFSVPMTVKEKIVNITVSARCSDPADWPMHIAQIASALTPFGLEKALTDATHEHGALVMHWLAGTMAPQLVQGFLLQSTNAKELVDAINKVFGIQATAVSSKYTNEFLTFQQKDGETILSAYTRFTSITSLLALAKQPQTPEMQVKVFLNALHDEYDSVATVLRLSGLENVDSLLSPLLQVEAERSQKHSSGASSSGKSYYSSDTTWQRTWEPSSTATPWLPFTHVYATFLSHAAASVPRAVASARTSTALQQSRQAAQRLLHEP